METNLIPINIISSTCTELNELDQAFMYSQLLKEIILEREYNKKKQGMNSSGGILANVLYILW